MKLRPSIVLVATALGMLALVAGHGVALSQTSKHSDSVIRDMDCSACHTPKGWKLAGGGGGGFDHSRTGFPLTGKHDKTLCTGCHKPGVTPARECSGCHNDQHKGRLGATCDQCHDSRRWISTRAIRRHRTSRLPLTGMHSILDCSSCHLRTTANQWDSPPADCFACHESEYRSDVHPVHQGDPADPTSTPFNRNCSLCHRPTGWTNAFATIPFTLRSSRRSTRAKHDSRFPISFGKHRNAQCTDCHRLAAQPRLVQCNGCHAHSVARIRQAHGGQPVAIHAQGCLACHPGGAAR